jgi:hypothetical protein
VLPHHREVRAPVALRGGDPDLQARRDALGLLLQLEAVEDLGRPASNPTTAAPSSGSPTSTASISCSSPRPTTARKPLLQRLPKQRIENRADREPVPRRELRRREAQLESDLLHHEEKNVCENNFWIIWMIDRKDK